MSKKIVVSAFRWVPPFVRGHVRDLRVRWALEEAGLDYESRLIGPEDQHSDAYRALQPFGQVPIYQEGDLTLFESGAIVHHIAQRSAALMPSDENGRARVLTWMFAALNSIEPHVQELAIIDLFSEGEEWAKLRRPFVVDFVKLRLSNLATALGGRQHLESDRFTAADLLMTTVLRNLDPSLLAEFKSLAAYRARFEERPAFRKALAAQMADFVD